MISSTFLRIVVSWAIGAGLASGVATAQRLEPFDGAADVGEAKPAGSAAYDSHAQEYRITGGGSNMWFQRDEFHFVWKRMTGDFILRAHAQFLGEGVDPHRKMGWMIRSTLDADSPYVDAALHGDGLTALQFRREQGSDTEEKRSSVQGADVVQLERSGGRYILTVAKFGEPLGGAAEISDIDLGDEVYVGLFVCSHRDNVAETAVFRNVRIVVPAGPDLVPYRDYLASNLEILDVETGHRTIVHQTSDSMQAPNWTVDGRALIYNRNGRLYRFDLERKEAEEIDTGFAVQNNNDHVLSFDGKMLGISHHSADDGGNSIIYTLPVEGGQPKRVTSKGPSYFHGWSPDGKTLIYTGIRGDEADIYAVSAEGGEEIRLTNAPGLDDGSEYSPDGQYIYFNSVRSGTMQLWRMRPDGSQPEQLTDDGFNNWFPHVSPDGKWVAFLSYSQDVAPGDHPFYKQVHLRLMPAEGGAAQVIACLYGGQGTINVPSWAPDSKRLAFVSNTGR